MIFIIELLIDYSEFTEPEGWEIMGLRWSTITTRTSSTYTTTTTTTRSSSSSSQQQQQQQQYFDHTYYMDDDDDDDDDDDGYNDDDDDDDRYDNGTVVVDEPAFRPNTIKNEDEILFSPDERRRRLFASIYSF